MSGDMSMSMDTTHDPYDQSLTSEKIYSNQSNPSTPQRYANIKPSHESWDLEEARGDLRKATHILSQRGLKLASRWAAEQLNSLAPSTKTTQSESSEVLNGAGSDLELYAKSIFDLAEYHRAAAILSETSQNRGRLPTGKRKVSTKGGDLTIHPPRDDLTSYGIYLRAYALYMAGERRKEEEVLELKDPLERTAMQNANLPQLVTELHDYHNRNALDAFGIYVYGVVLKEAHKSPAPKSVASPRTTIYRNGIETPSAQSMLIQSLIGYQYNWSAWLDLAELCIADPSIHQEVEEMLKPISAHWMYHFFCVHVFLENQANENAIMLMERLIHGTDEFSSGFFVTSPYLQSQLAVAHYDMRDFDTAKEHFKLLEDRDPQRLDQMDVYSNILYVKEDKVALSSLAHRAMKLDKYRPETCCIVGNYYSLKAQHEKAVQYFQRALKLDRNYLSAWTLMGHEYLEMKNTAAAIEAYRRAVDINPRDYRAWYGLGQTYEIMNMLLYALFYYRKAVELRPYDARMWCAMGGCYSGLERRGDAIKSYERAVTNHDAEGIATLKLATLYRDDEDEEKAARCYLRHLELRYQAQLAQTTSGGASGNGNSVETVISSVNVDEPEAEGLLFLAYYYRDHDEYDMATLCCSRLLDYPGPEKEEGKALQREIRSIIDGKGSGDHDRQNDTFDFSP